MNKQILYHGSSEIVTKPIYGKGKSYNDYGQGFYCTEQLELAKEWACVEQRDGYANKYELDMNGLKVLHLSDVSYTILHWLTILLQYHSELGRAISLLHKSETYLMVGIEDNYDLYMAGKKLEKGAYIAVSLFGNASSSDYNKMTAEICRIYEQELGIPGSAVYVTYHPVSDWGWNGANF